MFSNYLHKFLPAKVNALKHIRYAQQHVQPQRQQRLQQHLQVQTYRCLSHGCGHKTAIPLHINISGNRKRRCLVLLPLSFVSCASASTGTASSSSYDKNKNEIDNTEEMATNENYKEAASIYEFTVKDTHGNDISLEKYKGNVVLIVNIASQCGLTKNNYKKLTELLEKYEEKGLKILNFPCNQFGSEMPEEDGEAMVCHLRDAKANIGDVFLKIDVNGSGTAPLYQFLKAKQGGTLGSAIKWNFTKFLVNKEGVPVNRYAPTTDPMDIVKDIEKLL